MSEVAEKDIARHLGSRASQRKYFATIHHDAEGKLLDDFTSVVNDLCGDGFIKYVLIGGNEQSSASEQRSDAVFTQYHNHAVVHFHKQVGKRFLKEEIWDKLQENAEGDGYESGGIRWFVQIADDDQKAINYCTKELTKVDRNNLVHVELGSRETRQGRRTDLDRCEEKIRLGEIRSYDDALDPKHGVIGVCARHKQWVLDLLVKHARPHRQLPVGYKLNIWQHHLVEELKKEPDDRTVIFTVDRRGNSGKTWFCRYASQLLPEQRVQVIRPGRNQDVASLLSTTSNVFLMDVPRESTDVLQYRVFEELKDGFVQATKYNPTPKYFDPCHVVVFMNDEPDRSRLSADRVEIAHITCEHCVPYEPPQVENFGQEFSSDVTGDGPGTFAATLSKVEVPSGEHQSLHPYWLMGKDPFTTDRISRDVSTNTSLNPGLELYFKKFYGWKGVGQVLVNVRGDHWPSVTSAGRCNMDMFPTPGMRTYVSFEGNLYKLVREAVYSPNVTDPVGDDRDCWGMGHALQRQSGNFAGNPFARVKIADEYRREFIRRLDCREYHEVLMRMRPCWFVHNYQWEVWDEDKNVTHVSVLQNASENPFRPLQTRWEQDARSAAFASRISEEETLESKNADVKRSVEMYHIARNNDFVEARARSGWDGVNQELEAYKKKGEAILKKVSKSNTN